METRAGNCPRNTMRIKNLTGTSIILALGTERLYLEPTREPAIVQWTQKRIGSRHIEFGASHECLQVPVLEEIAHVDRFTFPKTGHRHGKSSTHTALGRQAHTRAATKRKPGNSEWRAATKLGGFLSETPSFFGECRVECYVFGIKFTWDKHLPEMLSKPCPICHKLLQRRRIPQPALV